MFEISPVTILISALFLYPIAKGFLSKFSSRGIKGELEYANSYVSFLLAMFFGIYFWKKIFLIHDGGIYEKIYSFIPQYFINVISNRAFIAYIVIIPLAIYILFKIFYFTLNFLGRITVFPVADKIERFLYSKKTIFKRIAGAFFQIPRSICYVLIAVLALNLTCTFIPGAQVSQYAEKSKAYNYLNQKIVFPAMNSKFAKQVPDIVSNSFRIVIIDNGNGGFLPGAFGNTTIYYNGVTLDEGVKSNREINEFAINIARSGVDTYGKAQAIYNWIGNNITYDYNKAEKVLNNKLNEPSGAIPAFETRKGICFDYACLFVAMCRANGIKVRLITGEGYNGSDWVGHAWNQVYIPEQDAWINVDTTFYKGGNYFDSMTFFIDHRNAEVAGEW